MLLKKIEISNFKSISNLTLNIERYDNSYTSMFVGINEVGKSNILQAMSFLETPTDEFNFLDFNNKNNNKEEYVDIYFEFEFENKKTYIDVLDKKLIDSDDFLASLNIESITKNVYLKRGAKNFHDTYNINWKPFDLKDYYIFESPDLSMIKCYGDFTPDEISVAKKLTEEMLGDMLVGFLESTIIKYETGVSFWKPDKQYLITSSVNLKDFKDNPSTNVPLKNIFALSDYKSKEEIKTKIEEIEKDHTLRRSLESELSENATEYFGDIWKHGIDFDIEISDTLTCNVHIKDKGKLNRHKFFNMSSRSEGFHQFASLILSLSIQNHSFDLKNRLILIDEPENHLHPSGIRDLMQELLRIGENNYVFLATHSCFMIDKKVKQRNFIIKKDNNKNTIVKQINAESEVIDDEVLRDAFGINVYKDFLSPYKLLVEGLSDKKIIEKTLSTLKIKETILITNGHGGNIVSIASRLNFENIDPLVVLDDDKAGRQNKDKISKIGGNFTDINALTLKELEPASMTDGTIEDLLGKSFIESKFKEVYISEFKCEPADFLMDEAQPFVNQIKVYLQKDGKTNQVDAFLENLKAKISEDFNPTLKSLDSDLPLLKSVVNAIIEKLGIDS